MFDIADILVIGLIFAVSYFIGSVNTSIIVGKIMGGIDVRNYGSGNAGATNALRTLGKKAGIIVVIGDCLKAVIACLIAFFATSGRPDGFYIAGLGAVIGHNFPLYFKFRGGKGVLVSLVAILFADWKIGLCVLIVSVLIIAVSGYVSLGSVSGAVLLVILAFIFRKEDALYIAFTAVLAVLSVIMHRKNIVRLFKGEENKLGNKKS